MPRTWNSTEPSTADFPVSRDVSAKMTRVRITRNPDARSRFALDQGVFRQDAAAELRLTGWAVDPRVRAVAMHFKMGKKVLASAALVIHRPRVSKVHADCPGADSAGFEICIPSPGEGSYWLEVENDAGQKERVADIRLYQADQPGLLFMHIAKAAGSTANRYFSEHFQKGRALVHIESEPIWQNHSAQLNDYDFLSGHVGLHALKRWLDLDQFRLVTVVREPFAQLISHIAWVRRLADPGEEQRLLRHPEYVQSFSQKLAECDLEDPGAITAIIDSLSRQERQLVDNCQVRYFTRVREDWVGKQNLESAIVASSRFDRIGLAENLTGFLAGVANDMGWPPPELPGRENVTRNFYGLERAGAQVRRALKPLVRYDIQLYDYIRRKRAD